MLHPGELDLLATFMDKYDFKSMKLVMQKILKDHEVPIKEIAHQTHFHRENFYYMLATPNSMKVDQLNLFLEYFGLKLSITEKC